MKKASKYDNGIYIGKMNKSKRNGPGIMMF